MLSDFQEDRDRDPSDPVSMTLRWGRSPPPGQSLHPVRSDAYPRFPQDDGYRGSRVREAVRIRSLLTRGIRCRGLHPVFESSGFVCDRNTTLDDDEAGGFSEFSTKSIVGTESRCSGPDMVGPRLK